MSFTFSCYGQEVRRKNIPVQVHQVDSLGPVTIRGILFPKWKKDTLEYNTSKILLRRNANVEELLGRLPGLQIDANGNITYNSDRIQRVLVDGEDLFGSDPTLITRNFDASKIAKIQLLDKKSDHTAFTGVDDGARTKILNLVLKESSRQSYFGKVEAGAAPDENYNANGFLASFHGKEELTGLGMVANTGSLGLVSAGGNAPASLSVLQSNFDALNASAGRGVPQFEAGAIHYANTWNNQENHGTGNYQFGHLSTLPHTTLHTIQTLPDTIYIQDQQTSSLNRQYQHALHALFDYIPDSLSAMQYAVNGSWLQGDNLFSTFGNSSFNNRLINNSQRSMQSFVSNRSQEGSISWRRQTRRKPARIFSIEASLQNTDNSTKGYVYSLNQFYTPSGTLLGPDTSDQRKNINNHTWNGTGSFNYTEPLRKNIVLGLGYGLTYLTTRSLQATYNKGDGKYTEYVDSLSNYFQGQTFNHQVSVNLQGSTARLNYTIGMVVSLYAYRQKDLLTNALLSYHYTNLAPRALLNYILNLNSKLTFNYSSMAQQPSITQMQSIRNNNDPLHITIGNPELRPSLNQYLVLEFSRFQVTAINFGIGFDLFSNNISTKTMTDSLGRQVSQSVNVNGGYNASLNFSISRRLLGVDMGIQTFITNSRSINYVDALVCQNDSYTQGVGISISKYDPRKYNFQLFLRSNHFDTRSLVNTKNPIQYWTQNHSVSFSCFLVRGFEINTTTAYSWQQSTSLFTRNTSLLFLNASIGHNFLDNKLILKLQANNILGKNSGIIRSNYININTETTTTIPGRFWLISLAYRFDHKYKSK
jgi:hypothetical protein